MLVGRGSATGFGAGVDNTSEEDIRRVKAERSFIV
jgi:hypothetical protein